MNGILRLCLISMFYLHIVTQPGALADAPTIAGYTDSPEECATETAVCPGQSVALLLSVVFSVELDLAHRKGV